MISLYTEIAKIITEKVPDAGWVDLYKGQLEKPKDFDFLTPCVLIDFPQTDWENLAQGNQEGNTIMIVRHIFYLPSRTHIEDPNVHASVEALALDDELHKHIRRHPNVVRRTRTRRYHALQIAPMLYVVEQHYQCQEWYVEQYKTTVKPPPVIGTTIVLPSQINNLQ